MRKITKDYTTPPASLTGAQANLSLQAIAAARDYNESTYKNDDVLLALKRLYYDKCGYCEGHITATGYKHVEHYRPKSRVNNEDVVAGAINLGYYWLGNEWSNLLIACLMCNGNGRKGTRFPLANPTTRVLNHPPLLATGQYDIAANHIRHTHLRNEVPLIINPETTDPKKHLQVEKTGELKERRQSVSGKKTIEICLLNRDGLIVKRKAIIDEFVNEINRTIRNHTRAEHPLSLEQFRLELFDIFDDMVKGHYADSEYTLVYREIIRNFNSLILRNKKIQAAFRPIIKIHFEEYCNR